MSYLCWDCMLCYF